MDSWWHRLFLAVVLWAAAGAAVAQTCAAPGKDAPAGPTGVVNTYYAGNGNLAAGATTLNLGAASGAAVTLGVGDLLLVIQMQGVTINSNDDERYGSGSGTAGATPLTTVSQANGYTALNQAGLHEFVRVTAVAGAAVTFTPALTNSYVQATGVPRSTYQVIRVPQLPGVTLAGTVTPLAWTGLVGGVAAWRRWTWRGC